MKFLTSFVSLLCIFSQCRGENIVYTDSGRIRGKKTSVLNGEVYGYLGIPYAVPPIGELRFKVPRPVTKWEDIYNATVTSPICMQDPIFPQFEWVPRHRRYMSEDCLYLNIWVPARNMEDKPFSTMVWIHGGGFNTGSANMPEHYGSILSLKGNVIVTSLNYRLGAFGFLSLDNDNAPGNVGLLDQVMALKWIHRNIESFGGDRNEITVFGSSAGSISVAHHLISPLTKGLFKRAILQSGSNYNPSILVDKDVNMRTSEIIATNAGCGNDDRTCANNDVISCLQNAEAEKIAKAENLLMKSRNTVLSFYPQKGKPFLSSDPIGDVDRGSIHDVEVMIGEVPDEGTLFLAFYKPDFLNQDDPILTKSDAESILKSGYHTSEAALKQIVEEYLGHLRDDDYSGIVAGIKKAFKDGIFSCSIASLAEKLSEQGRTVYHYKFDHARLKAGYKKWEGVSHFAEVYFVFGLPFLFPENYTPEEEEFSGQVINYWASFAKTGKPSDLKEKEKWLPFDTRNSFTMNFKLGNIHGSKEEVKKECQIWEF